MEGKIREKMRSLTVSPSLATVPAPSVSNEQLGSIEEKLEMQKRLILKQEKAYKESLLQHEKLRISGYREISSYTKAQFQEWLDGNALSTFKQKVTKKSSLSSDWVNLMNICA